MKPYYEHAGITIYHGDCLDVLPILPQHNLVMADPPYLMGSASTRKGSGFHSRLGDWSNASCWYARWMSYAWNLLGSEGSLWICGNWRSMPSITMAADTFGASMASVVVWDKDWIGVGSMKGLRQRYELIFQFGKESFGIKDRSEPDIWIAPWSSRRPSGHESEKPLELMKRVISVSEATSLCDPFTGSGTSLVAAKLAGITATGIEIEERYCEIAAKRLSQEVLEFA